MVAQAIVIKVVVNVIAGTKMAYKELSKYFSDDGKREATVYICIGKKEYYLSTKDEMGSSYSSSFAVLEVAEQYAEDWVMRK